MGMRDFFKFNSNNVICDRCGAKFKNEDCSLEWDGLYVCYHCYELRQPQDFVRGIRDDQTVQIARPRNNTLTFITTPVTPDDL